jgi:hypothetical protein
LISLCFSALKMMKADLNRLGASGAFLNRTAAPSAPFCFLGLYGPWEIAAVAAAAAAAATACCWAAIAAGKFMTIGKDMLGGPWTIGMP